MDIMTLSLAVKKALEELGVKTEKTKEYLIPQTNLVAEEPGDSGIYEVYLETNFVATLDQIQLAGGKIPDNVMVLFDGKTYVCDIVIVEEGELAGAILGNQKYIGGEDTGEPFIFFSGGGNDGIVYEIQGEHTFAVYIETETIHPIDPKFIPGVVLPVVELETGVTFEGSMLTPEDAEKMDALNGAPFLAKLVGDIGLGGLHQFSAVMNVIERGGGAFVYVCNIFQVAISIGNENGDWELGVLPLTDG